MRTPRCLYRERPTSQPIVSATVASGKLGSGTSLTLSMFSVALIGSPVGAGLPVIDTLHALMRSGDRLKTFEGVLSGSLSKIFGMLEDGMAFSDSVREAMRLGFTEPDPRDDLSGMDVARKALIIAREVGMTLELEDIEVEAAVPWDAVADVDRADLIPALAAFDRPYAERTAAATEDDKVLRYVARLEQGHCRVSIEEVPRAKPLGSIR